MDNKLRCQSCGMPLGDFQDEKGMLTSNYGTNADGTFTLEYCKYCFERGNFTNPDLTLEQMMQASVNYMTGTMDIPREKAEEMSQTVIPRLRRWQEKN